MGHQPVRLCGPWSLWLWAWKGREGESEKDKRQSEIQRFATPGLRGMLLPQRSPVDILIGQFITDTQLFLVSLNPR